MPQPATRVGPAQGGRPRQPPVGAAQSAGDQGRVRRGGQGAEAQAAPQARDQPREGVADARALVVGQRHGKDVQVDCQQKRGHGQHRGMVS